MTTWATAQEVEDTTGVTVTNAQLLQAQALIELHANRTADMPTGSIRTRDLHWLKQAVCWQAAWASGQADLTTRSAHTQFTQDGLQVVQPNQASVVLAPLAQRALKNLSWKGSRTVRTGMSARPLAHPDLIDYTTDASDQAHGWEPM